MVGVSAASGPKSPTWEPDANAAPPYGNLTFYDASGNQVTSGTGDLSSPFAYVVASTAADSGATLATVNFYNPRQGLLPASWTGTSEGSTTSFSPPPTGTPADLVAFATGSTKYPVAPTTANISTWLSSNVPDTTAGYANTIQVRLTDSGPRGAGNAPGTYWETDIGYNMTSSPITVDGTTVPVHGWAELFPLVSHSSTSLAPSLASPQHSGTQVTLTTAVKPSSAAGVVQFFDGTTMLGSPVKVASGAASKIITPAVGNHSYTADFVPKLGDETAANTATAMIIGGSKSNTVPYTITSSTPTVTVTKFSPTRLGQGASNIGVTLTGTEFVTGATVRVAGISFSSVSVANSTTITAKANVASSAKVGAGTVTVADSVGSGSCTTCLTIIAGPTVKSITPSSVRPGASYSVRITGTGFLSGATLTGPTGVTFSKGKVVSSTRITALMKVAPSAKTGKDLPVTVVNGTAGGGGRGTGKVLTIT